MSDQHPDRVHLRATNPDVPVRDPRTGLALPPGGRLVQLTPFWRRRIRDRSVEVVKSPAPEPKATAPRVRRSPTDGEA